MGWTGVLSEEEFKKLHELAKRDAPPLAGEMLEIDGVHAYLSLPKKGKPPFPAVLLIHEFWGLNDHIKHWADRLAADGYAALAIDLYGGQVATDPEQAPTLPGVIAHHLDALRTRHADGEVLELVTQELRKLTGRRNVRSLRGRHSA